MKSKNIKSNAGCNSNQENLPEALKAGIETLSGNTTDDVLVHYDAQKPANLRAQAYPQGSDEDVAPVQENLLQH